MKDSVDGRINRNSLRIEIIVRGKYLRFLRNLCLNSNRLPDNDLIYSPLPTVKRSDREIIEMSSDA